MTAVAVANARAKPSHSSSWFAIIVLAGGALGPDGVQPTQQAGVHKSKMNLGKILRRVKGMLKF
jgi:hypothetical protein